MPRDNYKLYDSDVYSLLQRFGEKPDKYYTQDEFIAMKEREIRMLNDLRKFNKDTANLDEMIALSAFAKSMQAEFVSRNIPVPEWLSSTLTSLGHEITGKTRDQLEKRMRDLQSQAAGLESASEKRERIARELAEVKAQLGISPEPALAK